ncbi:uncharacterized protein [Pseudorasbora parva]|uniref:uncharacterized protein n=1 Tax=Pseudorasbora parva TaxID=51549 RepID=UPI00351EF9D2
MSPECDKDRRIISCLQCFKPQEMLPNHLLRVCMKNQTDEERKAEVERAKKSMKAWTLRGRTWDYNAMVKLYPDEASRQALLEDLRERNFLILNDPKAAQDAQAESRHRPPGAAKPIQPTLQDCQRVLRVSQADMLGIHRKLLDQQHLEEDQRTLFRYFCEAILVLRYFQRPEAVKAFKASDWINKTNVDGRIHMEVQSTKQSATFSMTEEDSAVSSLTGMQYLGRISSGSEVRSLKVFINALTSCLISTYAGHILPEDSSRMSAGQFGRPGQIFSVQTRAASWQRHKRPQASA